MASNDNPYAQSSSKGSGFDQDPFQRSQGITTDSIEVSPLSSNMPLRHFPELVELVERNTEWAKRIAENDPDFFSRNYAGQRPKLLWIGCSDARVPESTLFNAAPGEIFVHRNVANTYSQQDDSINSVIMLAIQNLKIKHIMVVGHTACVGCQSALSASMFPEGPSTTPLQRFLKPLITLARRLKDELGHPPSLDLLVEENVVQNVKHIVDSDVIQNDWKRRGANGVYIHGMVYQLEDGKMRDLNISQAPPKSFAGE